MAGTKKFFSKRRKSGGNETNIVLDTSDEDGMTMKAARTDSTTDEIALPRTIKSSFFMRQQQQQSTTLSEISIVTPTTFNYDNINDTNDVDKSQHYHLFTKEKEVEGADKDRDNENDNENEQIEMKMEIEKDMSAVIGEDYEDSNRNMSRLMMPPPLPVKMPMILQEDMSKRKEGEQVVNIHEVTMDFHDFDLKVYRDDVLARVNDFSTKFQSRKHQLERQCKSVQDLNGRLVEICRNCIMQDPLENILSKVIARKTQLSCIRDVLLLNNNF